MPDQVDPQGPGDGHRRVLRGGGWYGPAQVSRAAYRFAILPGDFLDDYGFRIAIPFHGGSPVTDTMTDTESLLVAAMEYPLDLPACLVLADALEEGGYPTEGFRQRIFTGQSKEGLTRVVLDLVAKKGRSEEAKLYLAHTACQMFLEGPEKDVLAAEVRRLLASGVAPQVAIWENSLGMKFALIPPGEFIMGEKDGAENAPAHTVRITQPYLMSIYPVTQAEYVKVMGRNPSHFQGDNVSEGMNTSRFPVERVSWLGAMEFCKKLGELDGNIYDLPTEAQWEYGCRGGIGTAPFWNGNTLTSYMANFDGQRPYPADATRGPAPYRTCPVGSYPANPWGLYDMHGQVWEWCKDWYGEVYYREEVKEDPKGSETGQSRVLRGGSWITDAWYCRSAYRGRDGADFRREFYGFRPVLPLAG